MTQQIPWKIIEERRRRQEEERTPAQIPLYIEAPRTDRDHERKGRDPQSDQPKRGVVIIDFTL